MVPVLNALLVCVIFLRGLCGCESALAPHGRCTGNHCFALFQESEDFSGAQKRCGDTGGRLFMFSSQDSLTVLPSGLSGLSGSYWLELRTGEAAGLQRCSSISVSTGRNFTVLWEPCSDNLSGFLCQYASEEPCGGLQAGGGAQVRYTAPMGFEVRDSDTFPRGTIAVVEKAGAMYPDSKSVCFMSAWTRAPWNCEVLRGGCEHGCNSTARTCNSTAHTCASAAHTCVCPAGQTLHPNRITCAADPCANCAHGCQQAGDARACKCAEGHERARDSGGCVDVDECAAGNPCAGEGEECVNTAGAYECRCGADFVEEDGECVDIRICLRCEHQECNKVDGVYACGCRPGFRVSPADPAKCEMHCGERDCPASCIPNPDSVQKDNQQCSCPHGYIRDVINGTHICTDINECELEMQCDHICENFFGGYKCLCREGFRLYKEYKCEAEEEASGDESSSSPPYPTLASIQPTVPSYIKTGSILGIAVFMLLALVLLFFLVQHAVKRCGRFELPPIKHSNIDIFYLQQVTTETYKRLSLDKQFKNDPQIL